MIKKILKKFEKLSILDRSIIKICIASITLLIATLIPALVQIQRWIYAIIAGVSFVYILGIMFKRK